MRSVISGREIPKDLQGISGVSVGFDPPDILHSRIVTTGQPGSGKSTLLNSNKHLFMMDPERGGRTVADPQAMRFTPPPNTPPAELDKAYLAVADRLIARRVAGKDDIRMVGIDSMDKMIAIFQRALCLRAGCEDVGDYDGGHGKGYAVVRRDIFDMLDRLYQAGLGWAVIAHTSKTLVTVGKSEQLVTGLSMSRSYMAALFQECEHMLFVEHGIMSVPGKDTTSVVGGKRITKRGKPTSVPVRKLRARPGGLWMGGVTDDVKVRVPLPEEIVLPKVGGWYTLGAAYDEAVKTLVEEKQNG